MSAAETRRMIQAKMELRVRRQWREKPSQFVVIRNLSGEAGYAHNFAVNIGLIIIAVEFLSADAKS
jgi:hypothetical protein